MKFVRFLGLSAFVVPCTVFGAGDSSFQNASRLLSAARRGDTQTIQFLISNGADINFVDSTGLSLVCTAVMNNDKKTVQVLQMYGADSSNCDKQIKKYKQKTKVAVNGEDSGFFSGLSSTHILTLSAVGVAGVVGGLALLTDVFDSDNKNDNSGSSGDRPNHNGDPDKPSTSTSALFAQNLPFGPGCNGDECSDDYKVWEQQQDFEYLSDMTKNNFNYLLVSHAYDAFVRGYFGKTIVRNDTTKEVFDLSKYPFAQSVDGGKPVNVAMITETGVNRDEGTSAVDGEIFWFNEDDKNRLISLCSSADGSFSQECRDAVNASVKMSHKYFNLSGATAEDLTEDTSFDLTGSGSVFGSATESDTKLAKIIAGWESGGRAEADYYGFVPNGQLTVYKTGIGISGESDYKNYEAIYEALRLQNANEYISNVVANLSLHAESSALTYETVNDAKVLDALAKTDTARKTSFQSMIDERYNTNVNDDTEIEKPSFYANKAYEYLGKYQSQILVNPAGRYVIDVNGLKLSSQMATFENYAPAIYKDMENLFMTVVAVKPTKGTQSAAIENYNVADGGLLEVSAWKEGDVLYSSRICGLTGTGNDGAVNPWCFAAPGTTDLEAAASMAGSVALVKSAFSYMNPNEIFLLLALTADGTYLKINPDTGVAWQTNDELITYLQGIYSLPADLSASNSQYLESFKNAFGYGMINLERATRPGTNVYFYSSDKNKIESSSGSAYWSKALSNNSSRASTVFSLTDRSAIKTSFYDIIESNDGTVSLPRVFNTTLTMNSDNKHGLYMGDVLSDFNVDSTGNRHSEFGNMTFDMAVSQRAYNDNMNGLDNLRVAFSNEDYDLDAQYQHYLTDGESRFNGRANGLLALVSNTVSSGARYKIGDFFIGTRAFSGKVSDENLLESDPVISSQFEPGRLGFANGVSVATGYNNEKFNMNISFGNMNESNTVLGMQSDGLLSLSGGNTQYVDAVAMYKPTDKITLSLRGIFANTNADIKDGIISHLSDIKSNSYSFGLDIDKFSFTASMPLSVVSGKMGYDYADYNVVEQDGNYTVELANQHIEYIDLSAQHREMRFAGSYKQSLGDFTDAGIGFIYRVNPNNTDVFGNESILMFKIHHRLGI
nr:ankyrin repeat domain-containing protein [Candidatus Enterousia merdequi]